MVFFPVTFVTNLKGKSLKRVFIKFNQFYHDIAVPSFVKSQNLVKVT